MKANIVTEFFASMKARGLSQADTIRLVNKNCNMHYNSSRVRQLMRGLHTVPPVVLRYMVRQTLEDVLAEFNLEFSDVTGQRLSQRQLSKMTEKLTLLPREK